MSNFAIKIFITIIETAIMVGLTLLLWNVDLESKSKTIENMWRKLAKIDVVIFNIMVILFLIALWRN